MSCWKHQREVHQISNHENLKGVFISLKFLVIFLFIPSIEQHSLNWPLNCTIWWSTRETDALESQSHKKINHLHQQYTIITPFRTFWFEGRVQRNDCILLLWKPKQTNQVLWLDLNGNELRHASDGSNLLFWYVSDFHIRARSRSKCLMFICILINGAYKPKRCSAMKGFHQIVGTCNVFQNRIWSQEAKRFTVSKETNPIRRKSLYIYINFLYILI